MLSRGRSIVVVFVLIALGCSKGDALYRAEKQMFAADKIKRDLDAGLFENFEFLEKALAGYRGIVTEFGGPAAQDSALTSVVERAQLAVAELEFRADRITLARESFAQVLSIEGASPEGMMNAIYSGAFLAEIVGDTLQARDLYDTFYDRFLAGELVLRTVRADAQYLEAPLRAAQLAGGNESAAGRQRLATAERTFLRIRDETKHSRIRYQSRFALLTTLTEQERWEDALVLCDSMATMYDNDVEIPRLLHIKARIYDNGIGDKERALEIYGEVREVYPKSPQATESTLAMAQILVERGDYDAAGELYRSVSRLSIRYAEYAAEAEAQLARIETDREEWSAAAGRYKSIPMKYPTTYHAFESPLQLAQGYAALGQREAADQTYERALALYRKFAGGRFSAMRRLAAEEYVQRVYELRGMWEDAAQHLTKLAARYPDFVRLQHNYIAAADIYAGQLGDRQRAVEVLELCIQTYPTSRAAQVARGRLQVLGAQQ